MLVADTCTHVPANKQSNKVRTHKISLKGVLKAQEIIPLLSGGHVLRHDLLTTALMPTTEERLSNNVTSGIANSTSHKPDNRFGRDLLRTFEH